MIFRNHLIWMDFIWIARFQRRRKDGITWPTAVTLLPAIFTIRMITPKCYPLVILNYFRIITVVLWGREAKNDLEGSKFIKSSQLLRGGVAINQSLPIARKIACLNTLLYTYHKNLEDKWLVTIYYVMITQTMSAFSFFTKSSYNKKESFKSVFQCQKKN